MTARLDGTINICTWNATGIISSASYLDCLLKDNDVDVIGLSEHWLYNSSLAFLGSINNNYTSYALADPDLELLSRRN